MSQPAPIVVMAHGLGAVRALGLVTFAVRFCQAGYACLVFDYRHFGDSEGQPRELLDVRRQLQDWRSAVSFARTLQQVDPGRVGGPAKCSARSSSSSAPGTASRRRG